MSSKDELPTADKLVVTLQKFAQQYTVQTAYGDFTDILETVSTETIANIERQLSLAIEAIDSSTIDTDNGEFTTAALDNEDLYSLACLGLNVWGTTQIKEFTEGGYPYILEGIPCEDVQANIMKLSGRNVDFTPYTLDKLPTLSEWGELRPFVYDGTLCYLTGYQCIDSAYESSLLAMYDIGNGIYLVPTSVKYDDGIAEYCFGPYIAVFSKENEEYHLLKVYSENEVPTFEEIKRYAVNANPESNLSIDYSIVSTFTELSQYENALKEALAKAGTLNDAGNSAVTAYLEYAVQNYSPTVIGEKNNVITISGKEIETAGKRAAETMSVLRSALGKTVLEREPATVARIDVKGLSLAEPMQIRIGPKTAADQTMVDALTVTLGGFQHSITIQTKELRDSTSLYVQIEPLGENQYRISFLDDAGNVIEHSETTLGVTLPAPSENAAIQVVYGGNSDNWGGQYDPQNQTVFFRTSYTGDYTVLSETIQIGDIDMLPQEQQNAIRFMVSRGYLPVDKNGNFSPGTPLNRYVFAEALVRIFFTLDRSAKTTFTDVPLDGPYYPYVASGEQEEIINGYGDHTYRGENEVKRWHVILLCSRTLENKKGYIPPEDPAAYLNFVDNSEIEGLCNADDLQSVALAVREGLIDNGGVLVPSRAISKGEAAWMLYKLFMLLYEVSPAPMIVPEDTSPISASTSMPMLIGWTAVGCGGLGAAAYFLVYKKKLMIKR